MKEISNEKVEKYVTSVVSRKELYDTTEKLTSGNTWATLSSIINVAKQICVTNKNGKDCVLVWLGDHIYTVHYSEFVDAVSRCMNKLEYGIKLSEVPSTVIAEMDLSDKSTIKLINSTK